MPSIATKIVFPAVLDIYQFANQTARLGGVFPEVEIERIDLTPGTHHFKIPKNLPDLSPVMVASAVSEAETQIDLFWNILAYVLNQKIRPTGTVFYEQNGALVEFNPKPASSSTKVISSAPDGWFVGHAADFDAQYNQGLLKRFNYAKSLEEPIGRFVSLYTLLSSVAEDNQAKIDELIVGVDPNIAQSLSPKPTKKAVLETIFTKLRNELAHCRPGINILDTHRNIVLHLPRFEWVVKTVVDRHIRITP